MNPIDALQIAAIVLAAGINIGIILRSQRTLTDMLNDLKSQVASIDDEKVSKEVHAEVIRRIDGDVTGLGHRFNADLGLVRGEVSSVRHSVRNLEQRVPPQGPLGR